MSEQPFEKKTLSRREFLKLGGKAVLTLMLSESVSCVLPNKEKSTFGDEIKKFSWEDVENSSQLVSFTNLVADEYLRLSGTARINKNDLTAEEKTRFFRTKEEYLRAVRMLEPTYQANNQWGYTNFAGRKVLIDLQSLHQQSSKQADFAGLAILDALWHEWGHLDLEERVKGELLNNPVAQFQSPVSRQNEQWRRYRGGSVYTNTYYGYLRFNEVWLETINIRRMIEQVGLGEIFVAGDYYENGVDFFPKLTQATGISLTDLYQMYSTSDFEGLAGRIGAKLPGQDNALTKGVALFTGIHQSNKQMIEKTGALKLIPNR